MTLRLLKAETIIACNATHSLMQRTARWLLTMRHHIGRAQFPMTQETLALLLGVRRAGINEAIIYLRNIGAIRWRRSYVEISEEAKLIAAACECYRAIRAAFSDVA
jgi:CRP-like cAMP-binding protein